MNVGLIQSQRSPTKQAKNDAIKTRLKDLVAATATDGNNGENETD
jgi:hypothetical protein